ncbi:cytochrome P450 [Streptacidiphilus carbonis]|uniref:cytochrome P450 n=1 Tax=Streptacidiphilus carbonis TaxID=105422 RepID=UPI0005A7AC6E|nr:cytochrome P450 [Streptacidiphilus carbonis]
MITGSSPLGAAATLAELTEDPHPLLARLRAAEPVSWLPTLGGWLVTRRDLAVAVMRDAQTYTVDDPRFSTAQVVGPSMLSLDGPEHAVHRDPFTAPFRLRELHGAGFAERIQQEATRLVDGLGPHGTAELRRAFAGPLAAVVMTDILGLAGADTATVLAWYDGIVHAVNEITEGRPAGTEGAAAYTELRQAVADTVQAGARADSGRSLLLSAAGRLGLPELTSNAAVLLFGGIETTEAMIANALLHLLADPDLPARVRADDSLLDNAVEESLRLEPGAAVVDRYATRDTRLGPAEIRRGDLVTVSLAGANRDPAVFEDPDTFDIDRANSRLQLAFAHGPHYCLGAHLARLETRIALRTLLDALPGLRLDPERPSAPRGLVFRKPPTLHALWTAT